MPRFNRILSALESQYMIAPPIVEQVDPVDISDFMHHVLENPSNYKLDGFDKEWMCECITTKPHIATRIVDNLLLDKGHIVSRKSLNEALHLFVRDENGDTQTII